MMKSTPPSPVNLTEATQTSSTASSDDNQPAKRRKIATKEDEASVGSESHSSEQDGSLEDDTSSLKSEVDSDEEEGKTHHNSPNPSLNEETQLPQPHSDQLNSNISIVITQPAENTNSSINATPSLNSLNSPQQNFINSFLTPIISSMSGSALTLLNTQQPFIPLTQIPQQNLSYYTQVSIVMGVQGPSFVQQVNFTHISLTNPSEQFTHTGYIKLNNNIASEGPTK